MKDFARQKIEGVICAEELYSGDKRNRGEVANDLGLRFDSISPLEETDGPDDSDFYGFRGDWEQNAARAKLGIREDMKFRESGLEIYNENTEGWEEAQMRYGKLKENLERKISLRIGIGGLGGKLIERGGDRRILQKPHECRQVAINKNLPTILEAEENEEKESAISANGAQIWKIRRRFRKNNLKR